MKKYSLFLFSPPPNFPASSFLFFSPHFFSLLPFYFQIVKPLELDWSATDAFDLNVSRNTKLLPRSNHPGSSTNLTIPFCSALLQLHPSCTSLPPLHLFSSRASSCRLFPPLPPSPYDVSSLARSILGCQAAK